VIDWWSEFFSKAWPAIQSAFYASERTVADCDLIERYLSISPGARVLDTPCGTGRHCIELARRGYRMTGVDFNPEFIASAQRSAREARVATDFIVGDMRDLAGVGAFDAALCYFGSFGYFGDTENARFLRAVAKALVPGGRFLIDGHIAETLLPILRERDWYRVGPEADGAVVVEERHWDIQAGRIDAQWTVLNGSERVTGNTSMRIYTYRELRVLLGAAGFSKVAGFDPKTGETLRVGSTRALIVAETSGG
jgi:SAM-dependent methyltransferase